ncbi:MAG: prepilin-type N-terminal cleavage/methylation domain-containing protein [Actinobacteria bacterium]|nr:prepilin-type N-terminal cleavage/methylation domain-containing protein [Actinomycetota bacterium]
MKVLGDLKEREEGFSLVELLIAFAILALLVYAAFNILDVNVKAGGVYAARADLSQELRETGTTMVDQLRMAYSFTTAEAGNVVFTAYLTGTTQLYNVQFFLQGSDLIHRVSTGIPGPSDNRVLASDVTRLKFTYYDSAGSVLSAPVASLSSIAKVEIELTMNKSGIEDSITTIARIRK